MNLKLAAIRTSHLLFGIGLLTIRYKHLLMPMFHYMNLYLKKKYQDIWCLNLSNKGHQMMYEDIQ
ncbi:MAG: hypothetical protein EBR82_63355 [Caulobacteraceae bacterium]|nr:hypothetical protein [Caulobacteraceae bacterium]